MLAKEGNSLNSFCEQVAINLGDPVFTGVYHGKKVHDNDLDDIIQRALDIGCQKLMVTGSDLDESRHAVELAKAHRRYSYNITCDHPITYLPPTKTIMIYGRSDPV